MKLPTLYSRTATGAVQQWEIEIEGDSYWMISGQQDGLKVKSSPTKCKGKNIGRANETTPEEQALSEAQSKWDKKAKTGYTEDINNVDNCLAYIDPMLAKSLDDYIDKINFAGGVFVQWKFNGVRCCARMENGRVVLRSRKGEEWISVPHINEDLVAFFKVYPNAFLDGEMYNHDLRQRLNELIKIVRKTKEEELTPELLAKSKEMVRFYIYDGAGFAKGYSVDDCYAVRKEWIDKTLPVFSSYYRKVDTYQVHSMPEVEKLYGDFLKEGGEGAIVRIPYSSYEMGKRSKSLLKYKPEMDSEAEILALNPGEGNWAGTMKTATLKWKDKIFDATFKGTFEQGVERFENPEKWIGRTITFLYSDVTGLGVPNYARIDPDNCFKGDR